MSAKPSRRQSLTPSRASISAFRRSSMALQHPVGNEALDHGELQTLTNDAETVAAFMAAIGNGQQRQSSRKLSDVDAKSTSPSRMTTSAHRAREGSHFQQDPSAVQDLSAYLQRTASASLAQYTSGSLQHTDRPSLTELRPLSRYDLLSSAPDSRWTSALNLNDPSYLPTSNYAYESANLPFRAGNANQDDGALPPKYHLFASGNVLNDVAAKTEDTAALQLDQLGSTDTMYRLDGTALPEMGAASVVHLGPNPIDEAKKQLLLEEEMAKGPTEEEKREMARQDLIAQVQGAVRKYNALLAKNAGAQTKTLDYMKRKRLLNGEPDMNIDHSARYHALLNQVQGVMRETQQIDRDTEELSQELSRQLEDTKSQVQQKRVAFHKEKKTLCSKSVNTRTGAEMGSKGYESLEATMKRKEEEVEAACIEFTKLRNRLARHEGVLEKREELAEGLHLIDFEQLKIENQSYNAKVEGRNEDIIKLKRKLSSVVHILTHVKEKVHFMEGEVAERKGTLENLDSQVKSVRDSLPGMKLKRDKLKHDNTNMKQQFGLLGNIELLRDYEKKVELTAQRQAEQAALEKRYAELQVENLELRRAMEKVQKAQTVLSASDTLASLSPNKAPYVVRQQQLAQQRQARGL